MAPVQHKEDEQRRARNLVMRYGWNTMAYQILNPGISLWFSKHYDAVIGYVSTRTHVIVAGSPVAPEEQLDNVVLEFYEHVASQKRKVCFFGAQERIAAILSRRAPVSSILLGAQPVWSPESFLHTIHTKSSLRAQLLRGKNKGVTVFVMPAEADIHGVDSRFHRNDINERVPELKSVLDEWIETRHLPPMHFLVEPNTLEGLTDRIVVIARMNTGVIGFCIASPIPLRKGWLIEQIVRRKNAPNGTAELMLETMVSHLYEVGSQLVTLGLSPLSRHYIPTGNNRSATVKASLAEQPLWLNVVLKFTRLYGRSFYNFDGLDAFKAKFLPEDWEPVYAVTNEKSPTPLTLYAIATAFSGISPVKFVWKGVVKKLFAKNRNYTALSSL